MTEADRRAEWPRGIDLSAASPLGNFPVLSREAIDVARENGVRFYVMSGEDMRALIENAETHQLDMVRTLAGMIDQYVELIAAEFDPTGHPIN